MECERFLLSLFCIFSLISICFYGFKSRTDNIDHSKIVQLSLATGSVVVVGPTIEKDDDVDDTETEWTPKSGDGENNASCSRAQTRFLNNGRKRPKVGFVSFPRSGNTMTRILLERLTGIWTGSRLLDFSLQNFGFLGEGYQDDTVSLIKHHAVNLTDFEAMNYDKIIYLYRNPFDVFLSRMNKQAGGGHNVTTRFDTELFHRKVTRAWTPTWKKHVTTFVINLTNSMYFSPVNNRYVPVLAINYQDLMSTSKKCFFFNSQPSCSSSVAYQLARITNFLELPTALSGQRIEDVLERAPQLPKQDQGNIPVQLHPRTAEDFIEIPPSITVDRINCVSQQNESAYTPRKKEQKYAVEEYSDELRNYMIKELNEELCLLGLSTLSPNLTIDCDLKGNRNRRRRRKKR